MTILIDLLQPSPGPSAFAIVLLIAGIVVLLLGLLGRIKAHQFEGETSSVPIRIVICVIGVGLMAASYYVYTTQPRNDGPVDKASNSTPTPSNSTPTPSNANRTPGQCAKLRIVSPRGGESEQTARPFIVSNRVRISWIPRICSAAVQSYQKGEQVPVRDYPPARPGEEFEIGDPGSGETEIKVWWGGNPNDNVSVWVWIQ